MSKKEKISRKDFLSIASVAIGGVIGAAIGIPAVSYVLSPALKDEEAIDLIPLGSASKVEIGLPTLFKAKIQHKAGWIDNEQEVSFYVYTENNRDYIAISNVCTHLGCRVRWVEDDETFACPCHNASFSKEGEVISGPPPRALDRFQVVVENGQLFVTGETL
jgi:menaquinol-cytochrome c reductase iron-sulfur subunit